MSVVSYPQPGLLGERVRVYRNLHRKCLSVQRKVPHTIYRADGTVVHRNRWLVVAHVEAIALRDVTFRVSEAGRMRVIRTGRKSVHAFVYGTVADPVAYGREIDAMDDGGVVAVAYDPRKYVQFVYVSPGITGACREASGAYLTPRSILVPRPVDRFDAACDVVAELAAQQGN